MSEDKDISELIEKATLLFLGDKAGSASTKHKRRHLDAESADAILIDAEQMLCRSTESIYSETPLAAKGDGSVDFFLNVRNAAFLRCQIAGRERDFDYVLKAAKTAIEAIERLPTDRYDASITSAVLGYQGFALMKLQRFEEAMISLESSIQEQKSKAATTKNATVSNNSNADRRVKRERVAVQNALRECYRRTGTDPPVPDLVKFPRTSHLFDAGGTSTTSDDIVLSCDDAMFQEIRDGARVVIEEKVDGANLGISLCPMSGRILVQNRSHYISSGEHAQFSQITEWIALHRFALLDILSGDAPSLKRDGDDLVSKIGSSQKGGRGRFILYGEWVVARHSIPYQRLPGYFIAFDLFDKDANRFYSRERFHNIMRGSGIPVTPIIEVQNFTSDSKRQIASIQAVLRALLETPSQFRNDGGTVEGIVLRIDDNGTPTSQWLLHKSKVVRPDFIRGCAEGHWATRPVEKQRIDYEFATEYMEKCYGLASANETEKEQSACEDGPDADRKISGEKIYCGSGCEVATSASIAHSRSDIAQACSDVEDDNHISPQCFNEEKQEIKTTLAKSHEKSDGKSEKKNAQKMRDLQTEKARLRRRAPRIIMLCGLPGAGKSTFAACLNQSGDNDSKAPAAAKSSSASTSVQWTIVNQDVLGRKECVALAGRACRNKGRVILDRCNLTASERKEWMDIVQNPSKGDAALVYVATNADTCVKRVQSRVHHQTIPHGKGERIVRQLEKRIEPPTQEEIKDLFGTVEVLTSAEEVEALLKRWGA